MDEILLTLCTCLSCYIVAAILFQFMNDRYRRIYNNKYVYYSVEVITVVVISVVNLMNYWILNLIFWCISIAIITSAFYYDESDKAIKRIVECEVLLLCMGVWESLGVVFIDWVLKIVRISPEPSTMRSCMEITFSKVVVIFLYYMVFNRLIGKKKVLYTKVQWGINFIILVYSLVNMLVIAEGVLRGQDRFILTVNMGCIVLADLYLLYFIKLSTEKDYLESEVEILEKQANMQYEYYLEQKQKYEATVHILHDVDKHIKAIEQLYASGNADGAQYAKEIGHMLEPLIPVRYTGNPILDILLTDKVTILREKKINLDIKVGNVNLDFIEAIDVTTIFGNLIDNAVEAVEKVEDEKCIRINISPYQEMVLVRIENSSASIKLKNGMPVPSRMKSRGIGLLNVKRSIEKYDGDITFKQEDGKVIVDLLLNS